MGKPRVISFSNLPQFDDVAIIINVGTKKLSSLALHSVLKNTNLPLIMIDSGSKDGSLQYFQELNTAREFYLSELPLQIHGRTLDHIFRNLKAKKILLVDSDLELRDANVFQKMEATINGNCFGSGLSTPTHWLRKKKNWGLYAARMWIPFVYLDRAIILKALDAGETFEADSKITEFPHSKWISFILRQRMRIPILRKMRISFLEQWREEYEGFRPSYIYFDTGAKIFKCLSEQGYSFGKLRHAEFKDIHHYHGASRCKLNIFDFNCIRYRNIIREVEERLQKIEAELF